MSSGCFNALLMPQEPTEAGTDYTEKEVNKLFTTQRGCSVSSLHRLKGNDSTGHWAADGKGSLELPSSRNGIQKCLWGFNNRKSRVLSLSATE